MVCSKDTNTDEYDGIDTENLLTLEKLKQAQRQEYIQVRGVQPHNPTIPTHPSLYSLEYIQAWA